MATRTARTARALPRTPRGAALATALATTLVAGCAAPPVTEGVRCPTGLACAGARPVCCVELRSGLAVSCVDEARNCAESALACDEAADCAGGACCLRSAVSASGVTTHATCSAGGCAADEAELCQPVGSSCARGGRCCASAGAGTAEGVGVCVRDGACP